METTHKSLATTKSGLRACDFCRKKKVRCRRMGDRCEECVKFGTHCIVSPVAKRRKRRSPGHARIAELERQLSYVTEALGTSPPVSQATVVEIFQSLQKSSLNPYTNGISPTGELVSPSFPLRPPYDEYVKTNQRSMTICNPLNNLFPRNVFVSLPAKQEAVALMRGAFRDFNAAYPLFDEKSFFQRVDESYPALIERDVAWWACLNVVLAFAYRFRALRTTDVQVDDGKMWGYLKNALEVVNELNMSPPTLLSVQALLGIFIILQGTLYSKTCVHLLASTIKVMQHLGLHKRAQVLNDTQSDIEQGKRVFWIAYFLDQDISIRSGEPPIQHYEDMDVELPLDTVDLGRECSGDIRLFNYRIGLAIIQSHIYSNLMSARSLKKSAEERLQAAQDVFNLLRGWKDNTTIDYETRHFGDEADTHCATAKFHIIITQFSYFSSMLAIHRSIGGALSKIEESQGLVEMSQAAEPRLMMVLIAEAYKSIELVQLLPQSDNVCAWLLMGSFVPIMTVLTRNILEDPDPSSVHTRLNVIQSTLDFVALLTQINEHEDVKHVWYQCTALVETTRIVFKLPAEADQTFWEEWLRPSRNTLELESQGGILKDYQVDVSQQMSPGAFQEFFYI